MVYVFELIPRNHINRLSRIIIHYEKRKVVIWLISETLCANIKIEYKHDGNDSLVVCEDQKKEIPVKGKDFVTIFCDDLAAILIHQRFFLRYFGVTCIRNEDDDDDDERWYLEPTAIRICQELEKALKFRRTSSQKLRFEYIIFKNIDVNHILPVLPYLESKALRKFDLSPNRIEMNVDNILNVDQWKECEDLFLVLTLHTVSFSVLVFLRDTFFNTMIFEKLEMHYEFIDEQQLNDLFGLPSEDKNTADYIKRAIQVPNTERDFLRVLCSESLKVIHFSVEKVDEEVEEEEEEEEVEDESENESSCGESIEEYWAIPQVPVIKGETLRKLFGTYVNARKTMEYLDLDVLSYEVDEIYFKARRNPLFLKRILEYAEVIDDDVSPNDTDSVKVLENPVIMNIILKYLDCYEIQRLRKVSAGVRYVIDYNKPDVYFEEVLIRFENIRSIETDMSLRNSGSFLIIYDQSGEECSVSLGKYFKDDFRSVFCKDFELNLKYQNYCMKELRLDFSFDKYIGNPKHGVAPRKDIDYNLLESTAAQFLEMFRETLSSREQLIQVNKLNMEIVREKELLTVLPYVDPTLLKVIEIRYPYRKNLQKLLEVDEASKLEQWKNAEELILPTLVISTPIQQMNITHFSRIDIVVNTISTEDIVYLKQELLKGTSLSKFKITFTNCTVDDALYDLLEVPHSRTLHRTIWYFRFPTTDHVLHITYNVSRAIIFLRVESSIVPEDALVHD